MRRIGVVLMNLGAPNGEEAVQPFLYGLFMDDDLFKIPIKGALRRSLMRYITSKRAVSVAAKYKQINACPDGCLGPASCKYHGSGEISACCSSTNPITEAQRKALETLLNTADPETEFRVVTAMRYWHPRSALAIEQLLGEKVDEIILLPLYPHFSYTTTGSSLKDFFRELRQQQVEEKWKIRTIRDFHLDPNYLRAVNLRIEQALARVPPSSRSHIHLLFSAHGTPVSFERAGDPYRSQIESSVRAIMDIRHHDLPHWLSFQSRVGPVKWLQPNTEAFLHELREFGVRDLLVIPISFVGDHIETSMEIGIEFREVAEELGYRYFEHTEGLNEMPEFIAALKAMVLDKVEQPPNP